MMEIKKVRKKKARPDLLKIQFYQSHR